MVMFSAPAPKKRLRRVSRACTSSGRRALPCLDGEACRCAQFTLGIEAKFNEIGKDKIIQVLDEARVLFARMASERVQVDAEFLRFNITDGEQAIHRNEIRSADFKLARFVREREQSSVRSRPRSVLRMSVRCRMEGEFIGCEQYCCEFLGVLADRCCISVESAYSFQCAVCGGMSLRGTVVWRGTSPRLTGYAGGNPSHRPYSSDDFCRFISICNCR